MKPIDTNPKHAAPQIPQNVGRARRVARGVSGPDSGLRASRARVLWGPAGFL